MNVLEDAGVGTAVKIRRLDFRRNDYNCVALVSLPQKQSGGFGQDSFHYGRCPFSDYLDVLLPLPRAWRRKLLFGHSVIHFVEMI